MSALQRLRDWFWASSRPPFSTWAPAPTRPGLSAYEGKLAPEQGRRASQRQRWRAYARRALGVLVIVAALTGALYYVLRGSHPLGISEGDQVLFVTLKSGERITFQGRGTVTDIDGELVTVSFKLLGDYHYQTIDFGSVASWAW